MKLFARTVPRNKNLFSGTSLANKDFFAGTPQIGLFYILCPGNGSWGYRKVKSYSDQKIVLANGDHSRNITLKKYHNI